MIGRPLFAAGATAILLSGCATSGGAPPAQGVASGRSGERAQVFADASGQARRLEQQGRLRDALVRWRAAEAVEPTPAAVAPEIDRLRRLIVVRSSALIAQGDTARARRQFPTARSDYGQALDLSPDSPQALAGLKAVETAATLQSIAAGAAGGPGMSARAKGKSN